MNLISLQMKTCDNFEKNLENLKNLILSCKNESLILAPELALVGFAYDKMEEASIFSINTLVMVYNETTLNIFSNILAVINLVFVIILCVGSLKNSSLNELKKPIIYIVAICIAILLFKHGFIMNRDMDISCKLNGGFLCPIIGYVWYMLYFNYIGIAAIIASMFALLVDKKPFIITALVLSILASMLTNTFLGAIAFIIVLYTITKDKNKKLLN